MTIGTTSPGGRGSWIDRFATESTLPGVRYDEILLGADDRPRLRSALGIVTAILAFLVLGVAMAQLMGGLGWLILQPGGEYGAWLKASAAYEIPWGMFAGHVSLMILIPVSCAVVLFIHRRHPRWLGSVRPLFRWRYLVLSMLLAALVFSAVLFLQNLGRPFPALHPQADFWVFLLVIVLTSPLQAAAEEVFFRGYLLQSLHTLSPRSPWFGVVASAALFALFHGTQNLPLFLDRFGFGLLVGVLVVRTGGLEAAIGAHAINNVMAFVFAGLTSTIAQVKATQVIGWTELAWDLGGFGLFTLLAILLGRRLNVAVATPGARPIDPSDPWTSRR